MRSPAPRRGRCFTRPRETRSIVSAVSPGLAHHHIFNQYVIRTPRRDELRAHLAANGVGSEIYYPVPLHAQRCFAYLEHDPADFPEANRAASEVLALPIYPELTLEQREYVVRQIAGFFGSRSN